MDIVRQQNGEVLTTSKIIAEVFGKTHKHVNESIKNLDCSDEFRGSNFRPSTYTSQQNKTLKCYEITRDGFAFLCIGFTVKKAAEWKESYIKAFNQMEKGLLNIDSRMQKLELQASQIKQAGSEWSRMGHEINRAKKGHLIEVERVMSEVQMKLDFK